MTKSLEDMELARRAFLAKCGKYALVTPPVVTLMLSVSGGKNYALALSGSAPSRSGGSGVNSSSNSSGPGGFGDSGSSIGGGGEGAWDPGILQSRAGGADDEFTSDVDIVCRTTRATPSSWRQTTCARTKPPGFEIQNAQAN